MKKKIFLFVLAAHGLILLTLLCLHSFSRTRFDHRPIAVRTLPQEVPQIALSPQPSKKPTPTHPQKKSTPPATQSKQKKKALPSSNDSPSHSWFEASIPKQIEPTKRSDSIALASHSSSYRTLLIETLQQKLQLPETGEVLIRISLSSIGEIKSLEILDTKSSRNAEWLKEQLPLLSLPQFRDYGILDPILEFTITFRNAEHP
jgi:hypothetical protein